MATMGVRTLTMGFIFKVEKDISKGQFIQMCDELESFFGPGNKFEPLPGKGLRWAQWPGKPEGDSIGGKEIRLLVHEHKPAAFVPWPVVEENARELWRDDPSRAITASWYRSQLAAYGSAPKWTRIELELVRDCFIRLGVRVSKVICIRRLRYKDDALLRASAGK